MRKKRILLPLVLLAVLVGAIGLPLIESYRGFQDETFVKLEHGSGTAGIARTLEQVFQLARSERIPTSEAANRVAEERMRVMAEVHRTYKP